MAKPENAVQAQQWIVLGHDISANALGRAISMALVARQLGNVQLLAFGDGSTWKGAGQFDVPVTRLSTSWQSEIAAAVKAVDDDKRTFIWISKGLYPLDRAANFVKTKFPHVKIILDLDDDDAGLAKSFIGRSVINRLKLNPMRAGHPAKIRKSQNKIAALADGFTFSTNTLRQAYPSHYSPSVRIPHVRSDIATIPRRDEPTHQSLKVGAFGTLRPHKGSRLLLDLIKRDRSITYYTFKNCGLGTPDAADTNWVEIPPNTPIGKAYGLIDTTLIPITEEGTGAQFQLPAKLVDAMRSGVPIVASPTPAIREIAQNAFIPLEPSSTIDEALQKLRSATRSSIGRAARDRYLEILTPQAAAPVLTSLINAVDEGGAK